MKSIFSSIVILAAMVALISCGGAKKALNEALEQQRKDSIAMAQKNQISPIQAKYAGILKVAPEEITNVKLFEFIDTWMDSPYKLGGENKAGIDCSFLVQYIFHDVYGMLIERTADKQFNGKETFRYKKKKHLRQGDLIFFNLRGSEFDVISHVGLYLGNGKFVHSTAKRDVNGENGVQISDVNESHWKRLYVSCGRKKIPDDIRNSKL